MRSEVLYIPKGLYVVRSDDLYIPKGLYVVRSEDLVTLKGRSKRGFAYPEGPSEARICVSRRDERSEDLYILILSFNFIKNNILHLASLAPSGCNLNFVMKNYKIINNLKMEC